MRSSTRRPATRACACGARSTRCTSRSTTTAAAAPTPAATAWPDYTPAWPRSTGRDRRLAGRGTDPGGRGGPVRVVIAEDLALLRDGIRRLLTEHGFDVVAAVPDGDAFMAAVGEHRPDVCVVDV